MAREQKNAPVPCIGTRALNTSWCHPNSALRPFDAPVTGSAPWMFPSPLARCLDLLLAATRFQPVARLSCSGGVQATPARSARLLLIVCDFPPSVKPAWGQNSRVGAAACRGRRPAVERSGTNALGVRRPVVGADDPVRPRSPRRRHSCMLTKIRQSGRLHLWSAGALQATAGGFGYTS